MKREHITIWKVNAATQTHRQQNALH